MKTYQIRGLMLIIAVFLLFSYVSVLADPPCTYPCEDGSTWTHHNSVQFPDLQNCPGCVFTLTYDEVTTVCGLITYYNVYLSEVTYSPGCANCYSTIPDLLFRGFNLLLQEVKAGFNPLEPNQMITFAHISCWTTAETSAYTLVPCDTLSHDCCINSALYEFINGQWVVTDSYEYIPNVQCDPECVLTCDTQWFEKPATANSFEFTNIEIIPNPAKDYINVQFASDYVGEITLNLYDLNGNIISSNMFNKQAQNFDEKINLNNLYRGVYILSTNLSNDVIINSSTFVVE